MLILCTDQKTYQTQFITIRSTLYTMETIFMNTKNSKTTESNRFRLYFTGKLDLRGNRTIALANLSIHYTWQNIKEEYKNNKFKLSGPTWDETVDLFDGSYTVANIQDYFLWVIKKQETVRISNFNISKQNEK